MFSGFSNRHQARPARWSFRPVYSASILLLLLLTSLQCWSQSPAGANAESQKVFGQNLFTGSFAQQSFAGFNPNYRISVGDTIYLQTWGAVEFDSEQAVDAQGNIFVPQVGPIRVLGTPNSDLNQKIESAVARVYTSNVYVYASLTAAQPVKVFVTGNVKRPGLYPGLSSDSILSYLDRAGGIDPERGSYLNVQVKRDNGLLATINLYDFLIHGTMTTLQLREGDVLVVGSRQQVVAFSGSVENAFEIEFGGTEIKLADALSIANPLPAATHLSIERNTGLIRQNEYVELGSNEAQNLVLQDGDRVRAVSDKSRSTIGITVEGEHQGRSRYVLPYGASLSDLMAQLEATELSNLSSVRLFRRSLVEQQKAALEKALAGLEAQVLTARSDTVEEAQLRTQEAGLILKFVERARAVEPLGQVVLGGSYAAMDTVLENGDRIQIPSITNLVSVNGEVLFPSAIIYESEITARSYIEMAGGFVQRGKDARVILRKPSGAVEELSLKGLRRIAGDKIGPGDELLILPAADTKRLQYAKDIIQVIYQLALSAGVVLSINN